VYQRGNRWWLDYTAAGKRIREPGGNTEQEARAKLQEQLAKITLGQWTAPSRNTVGDAIDALLANWVTREVKSRVRAGKHLHQAKAEIGHIPLAKFQEAEADAWANTLAKKGYSRTTRDLKLRLLKAALKLYRRHGPAGVRRAGGLRGDRQAPGRRSPGRR
jgi:hypothetical protein